jgi:hypothetical protein
MGDGPINYRYPSSGLLTPEKEVERPVWCQPEAKVPFYPEENEVVQVESKYRDLQVAVEGSAVRHSHLFCTCAAVCL